MKFQIGAMTVGDILDRGLKLMIARFPAFVAINLVIQVPLLLFQLLQITMQSDDAFNPTTAVLGLVALLLTIVLSQIGSAAILNVIQCEFIDQPTTVGDSLNFAVSRFGALFATTLLAGLIMAGGFILCVVPMFIFAMWYMLASQVVVVENKSGMDALNRSKQLTEGYRGRVLGVLLLVIIVQMLLGLALGMALALVTGPTVEVLPPARPPRPGVLEMPRIVHHTAAEMVQQVVIFVFNVVIGAYGAICMTLVYFDLRIRKEGFDLEMAAKQQVPTS